MASKSPTDASLIIFLVHGTFAWGAGWEDARAIQTDADGNVFVTGISRPTPTSLYNYLTVKYDFLGNRLWEARYDGPISNEDLCGREGYYSGECLAGFIDSILGVNHSPHYYYKPACKILLEFNSSNLQKLAKYESFCKLME